MQADLLEEPHRSNRRRLLVFLGTLAVALVASLAFTWVRPAQYRAEARLEITPGVGVLTSSPTGATTANQPFLTEIQVLTSLPVQEAAATRLERSGYELSGSASEPLAGMQAHLETLPIEGTNIVALVATGSRPELLAPTLGAIVGAYQDRLAEAHRTSSTEALAQADEEIRKLEGSVATKRREVEAFRLRNNIVSLQRDENEVLARVRNLSTSLATANDRAAAAEGKVRALEAAVASGNTAVRARDDPTLANLEQRASQIREELRDVERNFTPDYMAKDPKVIQQRARLAELERQIAAQRVESQRTALLEAQQELAGAQGALAQIQSQVTASRQEATQFTARFNEYQSKQDELAELERAQREAVQRRAKLEATERARMPTTYVLEAATTPREPWRPFYWRDTGFSIGGSFALALLAVWLVELFNRSEPRAPLVLIQPQPGALPFEMAPQRLSSSGTKMLSSAQAQMLPGAPVSAARLDAVEPTLLPREPRLPRELRQDEVAALIRGADDEARLAALLLMSGLSLDEATKLRWSDLDSANDVLRINSSGRTGREVPLAEALRRALARRPRTPEADFVLGGGTQAAIRESIDAQLLCAAHDAALDAPTQVDAECLRHTYITFLVRQGIRFADLTRVVGSLPPHQVAAYSAVSPDGVRLASTSIERTYPALREAS